MDCTKQHSAAFKSTTDSGEDQLDQVEKLIRSLYIEKSSNYHRKVMQRLSLKNKNPFKRKFMKKQRRKMSICYSYLQGKHVLDRLENTVSDTTLVKETADKESKVMLKITDKLAKLWSEDGYRDFNVSVPTFRVTPTTTSKTTPDTSSTDSKKDANAANSAAFPESTNALSGEAVDPSSENQPNQVSSQTCARQAMYDYCDSVTELAAYLDEALYIPRMSYMIEMMYT